MPHNTTAYYEILGHTMAYYSICTAAQHIMRHATADNYGILVHATAYYSTTKYASLHNSILWSPRAYQNITQHITVQHIMLHHTTA